MRTEMTDVTIEVDFAIGAIVYQKHGESAGIVTAVTLHPCNLISYKVTWDDRVISDMYGFELSEESIHDRGGRC